MSMTGDFLGNLKASKPLEIELGGRSGCLDMPA